MSETFKVESEVIHGGILSLLLFVLVIDFVMQRAVMYPGEGIVWGEGRKLVDFDYADDSKSTGLSC